MCEPVSIMMAVGAVVGAIGQRNAAKGQQQALDHQAKVDANNATVAEWQAQDAEKRGQDDAARARRENSQRRGAQRVALAANGLDLNEGSALSLLDDTEYFGQVDQKTIADNTSREAWALRTRSQNFADASAVHKTAAGNINPNLAAGTSLLSSAASVGKRWEAYKA
jgi:hypothetical protein